MSVVARLPGAVFQIIIKLFFCHRQFAGVMIEPIHKISFDLFCPLSVYLPWRIFPFAQTLMAKLIAQLYKF